MEVPEMKIVKKTLVICLMQALILVPTFESLAQKRPTWGVPEHSTSPGDSLRAGALSVKIAEAKRQAKQDAKQKWTAERWSRERASSRGVSSTTTGTLLGFTMGASAGMLIGKGMQTRQVERTEHHPGVEWGDPGWTEEYYSYTNRHAPHFGALVGGVAGGVIGYSLGHKSDKYYYCLVPSSIRKANIHSSKFGNFLFGFGFMGIVTGEITGRTLYAPMSSDINKSEFGWPEFWLGYVTGSFFGIAILEGAKNRSGHMRLWERSISTGPPGSSIGVQVLPMDLAAVKIIPYKNENGKIRCQYGIDLLRVTL
jgi:hypothetical protein